MGLLVDTCGKTDDKLTVSKHYNRMVQVHVIPEAGKALNGISQGKGFGFVVSASGAIVASGTQHFLVAVIQDNKSTSPMSILRSSVELDVDVGTLDKSGSDWKMNGLLQGGFGGLHVFSQGVKVLRTGVHHQFGGGFGGVINNKLRLVEAEVDQEGV